jgi:excinuclease ABC subunit B
MDSDQNASFELTAPFKPTGDQPGAIAKISERFLNNETYQTLLGVTGSGKTFTMANIIQKLGKKALVLAPNKTLAAQLYSEFKEFFPHNAVEYFVSYYDYYQPEAYVPGSDTYIEKDASINDEIDKLRHSATKSLLERDDVIVVASVSCIYGIGSPEEYYNQKIVLYKDQPYDYREIIKSLISIQYTRGDYEFDRGKFRARGEIIEVFPPDEDEYAWRIEFFDNYIENIFLIDPLRGEIIKEVSKLVIYPSTHYVVKKEKLQGAIKSIQRELRQRIKTLKAEEKQVEVNRLTQRTLLDVEMMEEMGYCSGIENYSRHLTGSAPGEPPPTLIDFFKKDFLLLVDESHITIPQVRGMFRGDQSRKQTLVDYGFRLPSAMDNRPLNFEEFEKRIDQVLFVSATPGDYELEKVQGEVVEQLIRPTGLLDPVIEVRNAKTQVDDFLEEAKKTIAKGERVLVTTLTKKLSEELTNYYKGQGLKVAYLHSDIDAIERIRILRELRKGEYDILVGINLLREGIDLPEVSLVGVMDADKEGFLRSNRSLIQVSGRAARNVDGRVIMYGYQKTKSMLQAIGETERRREAQHQYNIEHGIEPKSVKKAIKKGVIETLSENDRSQKVKEKQIVKEYLQHDEKDLATKLEELYQEMKSAASRLEFEEAAKIRDQINLIKKIQVYS